MWKCCHLNKEAHPSQRFEKENESLPVSLVHLLEQVLAGFAFAPVPQDGFGEVARSAVVEEVGVTIDFLLQPDAPKWGGALFVASGAAADIVVVESHTHDFRPHVVEEVVGVGMDGLAAKPRQFCAVEQH